jgi:hypothetical protein
LGYFSKGKGEGGKREGEGQIAEITLGSKQFKGYFIRELFRSLRACSLGLSATSQQYFSLTTNQPLATSQQYFSLRTNQHQPPAKRTGCKL